jgi:hypothetical protein
VHRQDHDAGPGHLLADPSRHLETGETGDPQADDEHAGPEALDEAKRARAVAGLTDDPEVRLGFEQRPQGSPDQPVVAGEHDGRPAPPTAGAPPDAG